MSNLAMKVLQWQATGDVGVSSATMASIALGLDKPFYGSHFGAPHDPSDMLRCMKLLEAIPEIRDHFPAIAKRVPTFKGIIEQWDDLVELTKRVHQIFPDAEVKVKPMQANGLNSDASKSDREKLNRMLEDMFEESDMWLVSEFPTVRQVGL